MSVDHAFMVLLAKSFGLVCFVVASALVLVYALRPSARARFERAGRSIVDDADDRPVTGTTRSNTTRSNGRAGGDDG